MVGDGALVVGVLVLEVPYMDGDFVTLGTGLVELGNTGAETLGTRLGTGLWKGPLVKGDKDFEGSTSRPVLRLGRGDDGEGFTVRAGLLDGTEESEGDELGSLLTDGIGVIVGAGEALGSLEGWPLIIGICDTFSVMVGVLFDGLVRFTLGNEVNAMNEIGEGLRERPSDMNGARLDPVGNEGLGETEAPGHMKGCCVGKDFSVTEGSLVVGAVFGAAFIDGAAGTLKDGRDVTIRVVDATLAINGCSSDGVCDEEMNSVSGLMLWPLFCDL